MKAKKRNRNNWKLVNQKTNSKNTGWWLKKNFHNIFLLVKLKALLFTPFEDMWHNFTNETTRQWSNWRIWRVVFHKWTNWQFPLSLSLSLSLSLTHTYIGQRVRDNKERERDWKKERKKETYAHTLSYCVLMLFYFERLLPFQLC